jgi:hypothetical protein
MSVKAFEFVSVIETLQPVGEKAQTKVNQGSNYCEFFDSGVRNAVYNALPKLR